jgi:signal transduction histidine kinase
MFKFSFKNRIALNYITSTALLIFLVFIAIYQIVSYTVYKKVDENISLEVNEYSEKIEIEKNVFELHDKVEWKQREHNEVSVDPVFLQLTDSIGRIIEKSENLKNETLQYNYKLKNKKITDLKLAGKLVRQIQTPLFYNKKIYGYLIIAVSLEGEIAILKKLRFILYVTFPFVLIVLFFVAQFIAGRSIKPINSIIQTANTITNENLTSRIPLPVNNDELYILSDTINKLLDRIKQTIDREKQFTSDASHELRTPLSVIKGTLEVLIRKQRNTEEYRDKIKFCINEVDRINDLVDQLLLLARFENQKLSLNLENINLNECVVEAINRFYDKAKFKNITVDKKFAKTKMYVKTDGYFLAIILHNLVSNALKYSKVGDVVEIITEEIDNSKIIKIIDNGIGISESELNNVFEAFYRATTSTNFPEIKGTGLGLSIAKRLCDILEIDINIISKENIGTTLILTFASSSNS